MMIILFSLLYVSVRFTYTVSTNFMKDETIQIKLLIKELTPKLRIYDINSHIMHLRIMYKKYLPVSVSEKVE